MMNCRKAEQLIPLFVEADLDVAQMRQVTKHLETCALCRGLVAEFQASQSSLRTTTAPAFDEAMLVEMCRAVNGEIVRMPAPLPVIEWLLPRGHWKLAGVAVVMLCVSGFVFYSQFKTKSESVVSALRDQLSADACCGTRSVRDLNFRAPVHDRSAGRLRSPYRNQVAPPAKQVASVLREKQPPSEVKPENSVETATASLFLAFAQSQPEETPSAPEPEMLRMEIQTADPNIKIIWLTPKEPARTNTAPIIEATK